MIRPQAADLETKTGVDHSRDQVTSKDLRSVWVPISSRVCEGRSVSERGPAISDKCSDSPWGVGYVDDHPSGWDWSQIDRSKEARSSPGNLICVVWFMFEERIRFGQELEFSIGECLTPSISFFVPYLFGV